MIEEPQPRRPAAVTHSFRLLPIPEVKQTKNDLKFRNTCRAGSEKIALYSAPGLSSSHSAALERAEIIFAQPPLADQDNSAEHMNSPRTCETDVPLLVCKEKPYWFVRPSIALLGQAG